MGFNICRSVSGCRRDPGAKNLLRATLLHPQTQSKTHAHTDAQQPKTILFAFPRHSFFGCSIKGERLFPLFPGKWILYQLCVCKSDLHFQEKQGVLLLSPWLYLLKLNNIGYNFSDFPPACWKNMLFLLQLLYLQWNKSIKVQSQE